MSRSLPLLSICIPTYNRANLLDSALHALIPQVNASSGAVELIVSDNCSTDNTQQVVERARASGPIQYHRNSQNEGVTRNILRLTNELANGEFAWVLGDDDLVRPEGVGRVLAVLRSYPEVDYVFVNTSTKRPAERHAFGRLVSGADFPELLPAKAKSLTDQYVEKWEDLIDPEVDDVFLGAIMCSVFRLSRWRTYPLELKVHNELFSSLENCYPHSIILAHTMIGRKAYYVGYPCTVTFFGGQEWRGYLPLISTVRLQELLDLYRLLGVDVQRVEKCRRFLLGYSAGALRKMILDPDTPGREYFSLREFLWRNRHHPRWVSGMLASILRTWVVYRLPKPVLQVLRAIKRYTTSHVLRCV